MAYPGKAERDSAISAVFFGDSSNLFSNRHFEALLASGGHVCAAVDTPKDGWQSTHTGETEYVRPFTVYASEYGIPLFAPADPNAPEIIEALRELRPDLFIAVGYNRIIRDKLLHVPRFPPCNFHASLLPAYRGRHPVFRALMNDEQVSGLTVHLMDSGIDTGDIVYQVRVRTRLDDTVASLYKRIMDRSAALVPRLIKDAEKGRLPRRPQGSEGASYYSRVTEETFRLDISLPARLLRRRITVVPGKCWFIFQGDKVYVHRAEAEPASCRNFRPGTVIKIGRSNTVIAAGSQTALRIGAVSAAEGEEPVSMAEFCRRRGIGPGDLLTDFNY